jgi:hypothetical protein
MKLIILYDKKGKIVSITEVRPGPLPGIGVGVIPPAEHSVLELEKTDELEGKNLRDIHQQYIVDMTSKKLVKSGA